MCLVAEWFVSFCTLFVLKRKGKIATGVAAVVYSSLARESARLMADGPLNQDENLLLF